jgi:3-dehydroquinate dehydratase
MRVLFDQGTPVPLAQFLVGHTVSTSAREGWSRTGSRPLRIILLDGPNMPNLGNRNKRVYGPIASIEALHTYVKEVGAKLGVTIDAFASNHEGCILDEIHRTAAQCDAYIINPAGLTKTGEPTRHALEETGKPWIEVHFSNISEACKHDRCTVYGLNGHRANFVIALTLGAYEHAI